jgi:hypothetical protein
MKRKQGIFFGFAVLMIAAMASTTLTITLAGCDNGSTSDPGGGGGGGGGGDFTAGWPPASVLAEFGISGLTAAPAGTREVEYNKSRIDYDEGTVEGLGINFKGYATSDNPFHTWLIGDDGDWVLDEDSSYVEEDESRSYWVYYKDHDKITYGWSPNMGSSLIVTKNYALLGTD